MFYKFFAHILKSSDGPIKNLPTIKTIYLLSRLSEKELRTIFNIEISYQNNHVITMPLMPEAKL